MSQSIKKKKRKRPSAVSINPFLSASSLSYSRHTTPNHSKSPSKAITEDDALLDHVLVFTAASATATTTTDGNHPQEHAAQQIVQILLTHTNMHSTSNNNNKCWPSTTLSKIDVAELLLPWAIQKALYHTATIAAPATALPQSKSGSDTGVVWKALSLSLAILHPEKKDARTARQQQHPSLLTQSVLFKLIPVVIAEASNSNRAAYDALEALLPLYHPVMDVACKIVLEAVLKHQRHNGPPPTKTTILFTVLQWMHGIHQSRRANHKTTFQLWASPAVFANLCEAYAATSEIDNDNCDNTVTMTMTTTTERREQLLGDMVTDGFFHVRHHMEGFVTLLAKEKSAIVPANDTAATDAMDVEASPSTTKETNRGPSKSLFKSYHEELLHTIHEGLSRNINNKKGKQSEMHMANLLLFLPTLLRGFFEQSKEWERRERESKGRKVHRNVSTIQFRLFQRWGEAILVQIENGDGDLPARSLAALRKMLDQVLEWNVYAPSHNTSSETQYCFLYRIVTTMVGIPKNRRLQNQTTVVGEAIQCLNVLLKLNYLLLHEQMTDAMLLCFRKSDRTMSVRISAFIVAMVDTYKQLRQQRHIFDSILNVGSVLLESKTLDDIAFLHDLMLDQDVSKAIALAVQSSPILEVVAVFDTIISRISTFLETPDTITSAWRQCGLDVAVRLTTVAMGSIQVDRGSSSLVVTICQKLVDGPVLSFASTGKDAHLGPALTLYGRILELHNRCIFWLGKDEKLRIPSNVHRLYKTCMKEAARPTSTFQREALLFSCYRLQQVHSLIHDQERDEMGVTSSGSMRQALVDEARTLSSVVATAAQKSSLDTTNLKWNLVAQHFRAWIAYATSKDVDALIKWMIVASIEIRPLPCVDTKGFDLISSLKSVAHAEEEAIKGLLKNATFYESEKVASRLLLVSLSTAAVLFSEYLDSNSSMGQVKRKRLFSLQRPQTSTYGEILSLQDSFEHATNPTLVSQFKKIKQCIVFANGASTTSPSESEILDSFDLALKLDCACQVVCNGQTNQLPSVVLTLSSALRASLTKMLQSPHRAGLKSFIGQVKDLGNFACSLIKSCLQMIRLCDASENSQQTMQFTTTTGGLLESFLDGTVSSAMDDDFCRMFISGYCALVENVKVKSEKRTMVALTRYVLRGLNFSNWKQLFPAEPGMAGRQLSGLYENCMNLAVTLAPMQKAQNGNVGGRRTVNAEADFVEEEFRLLGDLLFSREIPWLSASDVLAENLLHCSVVGFNTPATKTMTDSAWTTLCYMASRLARFYATPELLACITGALLERRSQRHSTVLLDATFCHLLAHVKELESTVSTLTANGASPRLLRLFLRYTQESETLSFNSYGEKIFHMALEHMSACSGGDVNKADTVAESSMLLEDLMKRRDVYIFKERDLALVLSYICGVLGSRAEALDETNESNTCDAGIFVSTSDLIMTMFQRYPKHLFACVPSVVTVLNCLLRCVMDSRWPDVDLTECGQSFARICALLVGHKEIYKKHAIGLILTFVHGLKESSFSPHRRTVLIPAMYCLLDAMSTFETQQLNALMDTKAKALFRTIHQSYEKQHTYKGQ